MSKRHHRKEWEVFLPLKHLLERERSCGGKSGFVLMDPSGVLTRREIEFYLKKGFDDVKFINLSRSVIKGVKEKEAQDVC